MRKGPETGHGATDITLAVVLSIERALEETRRTVDPSQFPAALPDVAHRLQVPLSVVEAIAFDKNRPVKPATSYPRPALDRQTSTPPVIRPLKFVGERRCKPTRCPQCDHLIVIVPCRICEARRQVAELKALKAKQAAENCS